MRLHFGVAMPEKGGRPAIVGVEVREGWVKGRISHQFQVGLVDRVQPFGVENVRERLLGYVDSAREFKPCVITDVLTPQGLALHQVSKAYFGSDLHKPHAFVGSGIRSLVFSSFLQAYTDGRVSFHPRLEFRQDLDRALLFYGGGGVAKSGVELSSEDEALVVALGLALQWPKHGAKAAPLQSKETA